MKSTVSVLIPCFNSEEFVADAVESVLSQSYPNVQVIVVDDGSTDKSVEMLRTFGSRIVVEAGPNRGACVARNRAFELSSGEFIQYLDADDMLVQNKLERQVEILTSQPFDITFCKGYIFDDGKPERPKKRPITELGSKDPFVYCLYQGLATEGPLIRRTLIERAGGFDPTLKRAQEWDFHIRLCAAGARLHFLPELLYRHRHDDRPDRITRRKLEGDFFVSHLIRLGQALESESRYDFDVERRIPFCELLVSASLGAIRQGFQDTGKEGVDLAHRLCAEHKFQYSDLPAYNLAARFLGVNRLESYLKPFRAIRNLARRTNGQENTK